MVNLTLKFYKLWNNRLSQTYPHSHHSIATWLVGKIADRYHQCSTEEISQLITYRYHNLEKRYLNTSPKQGYNYLIFRLSAIVIAYPPIKQKIDDKTLHRNDILLLVQQLVEKILHHDQTFQKTLDWIGQCTSDQTLKNVLTLASLEEYCGEVVEGKPLILDHLRHFLTDSSSLAA
ncbi:MAG: hypothetical protein AB4041_16910 [Microcystaceae cyanobacterium]